MAKRRRHSNRRLRAVLATALTVLTAACANPLAVDERLDTGIHATSSGSHTTGPGSHTTSSGNHTTSSGNLGASAH